MPQYDDEISALIAEQRRNAAVQARIGFHVGAKSSPDLEAELRRVARETGVPIDTARAYPAEIKAQAAAARVDFDGLAQVAPATARMLADVDAARIVHDDVGSLTGIEQAIRALKNSGKALASAGPRFGEGVYGVGQAAAELAAPLLDPLAGTILPENPLRRVAAGFADFRANNKAVADGLMPKADGPIESGWYSGLASLGSNLLAIPAALTAGPAAGLGMLTVPVGGQAYGQARDKGVAPLPAAVFGTSQAAIEYATEKIPMSRLLGDLAAKTGAAKMLTRQLAAEIPGEQVATLLQDANEWAVLNPEKTAREFLAERPSAALQTLIATVVGTGGMVAVTSAADKVMQRAARQDDAAQRAEGAATAMQQVQQVAEASKLLQRDGQTLQAFMQSAAEDGAEQVFIDPQQLAAAGVNLDALALAVPSVAAQLQSVQTGGDLVIPTGELLVGTIGTEYAQALIEHVRTAPDAMSLAEAKTYMAERGDQITAQIAAAMSEQAGNEQFTASRDQVREEFTRQLDEAKRFTSDVNRNYSALLADFYAVTAAKVGVTPAELAKRYPLRIAAQGVAGANTLEQGAVDTPEFKAWFGDSKVVDAEGRPLVVFHGTAADFESFDNAKTGANDRGLWGRGHYFAANPDSANSYALRQGDEARVIPAYVSVKNPLILKTGADLVTRLPDGTNYRDLVGENLDGKKIKDMALAGGHDGVIQIRPSGMIGDVVAYDAKQIKSATGNNGQFDPDDPSILNQEARGQTYSGGVPETNAPGPTGDAQQGATQGKTLTESQEAATPPADGFIRLYHAGSDPVRGGYFPEVPSGGVFDGMFSLRGGWGNYGTGAKYFSDVPSEAVLTQRALDHDLDSAAVGDALRKAMPRLSEDDFESAWTAVIDDQASRVDDDELMRIFGEDTVGEASWDAQRVRGRVAKILGFQAVEMDDENGTSILITSGTPLTRVLPNEQTASDSPDVLNQQARGQIAFGNDITTLPTTLTLLKGADLSTFIHESGHFFLEVQSHLAGEIQARIQAGEDVPAGEREIVADMNTLLSWFGVKETPEQSAIVVWQTMTLEEKRQHHETFARGFEAYAFEGKAPSLPLQSVFQRFRAWLVNVYKTVTALNVEITDEVRGVMDRMIASTRAIEEAEAARAMGPLFTTAEEAGATTDEFKAYHDLGMAATQDAIQELQGRGLRDMRWLQNAKGRKVKELQKLAAGLRRDVEREVRATVMSQPLYRAWQFLTSKAEADQTGQPSGAKVDPAALDVTQDSLLVAIAKLGGLNRDAASRLLGVHKDDYSTPSGVFGKPVFRKEGGRSPDSMLELLAEARYLNTSPEDLGTTRDLEEAIADELFGSPRYSAWKDYSGEMPVEPLPDNVLAGKLNTAALREQYGTRPDAIWRKLSDLRMTSEANGLPPDVVAETFGFSSGDELVRALAAAEPPKAVIEAVTDQRMLERHGELSSPDAVERAADAAIHNEARGRFIATELAALDKAGQVREKVPGQRNTVDVMARAAKDYAAGVIARLKVRDIRPSQYTAAEARAAKAAEKAFRSGDTAEAAAQKRNQLIQHQAARAANDAREEVRRTVDYLRRFESRPKSVAADYLDQIEALLERFDLRTGTSLKEIDRRKSLAAWVESQREQGIEPEIPDALLNEAFRQSWRDMTVEELRGLRDTVKQIENLGRLKGRLLTSQAERNFDAARDTIVESINANARGRTADTRMPSTKPGRWRKSVRDFSAAHMKAANLARVFDGGHDGGPVWEYLIRPANERGDMETTMRAEATQALHAILDPLLRAGPMGGKGRFFESIGRSMNREQVLAMALNMGNEGNMQRMLDGEGWTLQRIQPVLATLNGSDWRAVQAIWDHFESYRDQIGAKERRVYGKEPDWVEPVPLQITAADGVRVELRGGYYPVKYDPLANNRAEQHSDAEDLRRQLQGAYTSATTRRGFTKARSAEVKGRPLLYSLAGVYSGVNDVIHDLAWHEWLIDANKLLSSDKIDNAIRSQYGPAAVQQLKTWVRDVAAGEQGAQNAVDMALSRLRQGVSIAGLGFNVTSAAMQPLGITQSIVRVGAKWVGRGMTQFLGAPRAKTREVNEKSAFMAARARTRFRELNELRNQVEGETKARAAVTSSAYFLMMRCQQLVDVPTWLGAYEKAISEGNEEDRAIALSDQAVIDSQGGGQVKDLSAIERGGPAQKLFTVFYSYMNTALNLGVVQTMTAKSRGKLAADYLMLYTVPVVLGAFLKDALTPGDAGDDDPEALLKKLLGEQLAFLMGLMVVVREFGEAGKTVAGLSDRPRDYAGPAGVRMIGDAGTVAKQIQQGELDDAFRKAAVNLAGDLLALPAAQVNRTITGAQALADGETANPAALAFGYQRP